MTHSRERSGPRARSTAKMLESLVCPISHEVLRYDAAAQELISPSAQLAFPIREGVPVLLISEARELLDS